jgi:hypothetical protein
MYISPPAYFSLIVDDPDLALPSLLAPSCSTSITQSPGTRPGVNVIIAVFGVFKQIFRKNWRFSLENQCLNSFNLSQEI